MDERHSGCDRRLEAALAGLAAVALTFPVPLPAQAGDAAGVRPGPAPDRVRHELLVAGESEDRVDFLRFDGERLELLGGVQVGRWPTEIDGPHGLAAAPDAGRWYVTLAHGNPFGYLAAYEAWPARSSGAGEARVDRPVGEVELGLFPATVDVTASGLLFVANFNLHGDPVPGSVSVVDAESMQEIARIETCVRPHGSRLTRDGRHYSVCVADDELVEIDVRRLRVARRLVLTDVLEGTPSGATVLRPRATAPTRSRAAAASGPPCSPTWAQPAPDAERIYVACNGRDEVLEVDAAAWTATRRFRTGAGPYNLEVTPDGGRLVVTYRGDQAVGIWDLVRGEETARVRTTRRLPHGVIVSPDGRYAFVSVEGVGGEPGAVDVIDLAAGRNVATTDVGKQAAGIAYWRATVSPGERR